jgi:hypothetical protein
MSIISPGDPFAEITFFCVIVREDKKKSIEPFACSINQT